VAHQEYMSTQWRSQLMRPPVVKTGPLPISHHLWEWERRLKNSKECLFWPTWHDIDVMSKWEIEWWFFFFCERLCLFTSASFFSSYQWPLSLSLPPSFLLCLVWRVFCLFIPLPPLVIMTSSWVYFVYFIGYLLWWRRGSVYWKHFSTSPRPQSCWGGRVAQ